jgi:branched-chain amino acid transport system substrate-binding protein
MLPVFKPKSRSSRHRALQRCLFYPSVYEGFEYTPKVIYGGAVTNQMVIPLLEYIFEHHGHRVALLGSDTLYAREINRNVE